MMKEIIYRIYICKTCGSDDLQFYYTNTTPTKDGCRCNKCYEVGLDYKGKIYKRIYVKAVA